MIRENYLYENLLHNDRYILSPFLSLGFPKIFVQRLLLISVFSQVSFNAGKTEDLRYAGGPVIPEGFALKGTLDLFSYQIKAHIKYNPKVCLFTMIHCLVVMATARPNYWLPFFT